MTKAEFKEEFEGLGLRYFKYYEFLTKGAGNRSGPCEGKNTDPTGEAYENMIQLAPWIDEIRFRFGNPVMLTSVFRSKAYNACLSGTATNSMHLIGNAADMIPLEGSVADLWEAAKEVRDERGAGGVGRYSSFVHFDRRDGIANW